jgi:hypothetical protein
MINKNYPQIKILQIEQFYNQLIEPSQLMIHTDRPHINILSGNSSDAKLKYLNINDYFEQTTL